MKRRGANPGTLAALAAIRAYQRWISPYKGFCCALRVATGGESCSAYGKRVIGRFGLRTGLPLLRRRLALCGQAHRSSSAARTRLSLRHREAGHCDVPCDLFDLADGLQCGCDVFDWFRNRRRDEGVEASRQRKKSERNKTVVPAQAGTQAEQPKPPTPNASRKR